MARHRIEFDDEDTRRFPPEVREALYALALQGKAKSVQAAAPAKSEQVGMNEAEWKRRVVEQYAPGSEYSEELFQRAILEG